MNRLLILIILLLNISSCLDNHNYLYRIVVHNKVGYINKTGKIVIKPKYDYYEYPRFDYYRYHENDYPYNKRLFSKTPIFNYGDPFAEGLAIVKYKGKWGYINTNGTLLIKAKYDEAFPFKEGKAGVCIGSKWGYIDRKGKIVIEPEYEEIFYFFEECAWVKKNGKYGFINKNGKIILPIQYDFNQEDSQVSFLRCGILNFPDLRKNEILLAKHPKISISC